VNLLGEHDLAREPVFLSPSVKKRLIEITKFLKVADLDSALETIIDYFEINAIKNPCQFLKPEKNINKQQHKTGQIFDVKKATIPNNKTPPEEEDQ
jgi:hypothetical protein